MEYADRRTSQKQVRRNREKRGAVHEQLLSNVQAKLEVSEPGDSLEAEANAVAGQVMRGQQAEVNGSSSQVSHRQEQVSPEISAGFESSLSSSKGSGIPLNDSMREEMESKLGVDMSDVKVHTDAQADAMSKDINAKAFTHGQDIYFKEGEYNPASSTGKELLAHELVHTVQQSGATGAVQRKIGDPQWEEYTVTAEDKSIFSIAKRLRDTYAPAVSSRPKEVDEISNAIIAHNGKNTVSQGDRIEVPTKAYFDGLGAIPTLKKTDITYGERSAVSPQEGDEEVLFKKHFIPGSETFYTEDGQWGSYPEALINRTHFSNVDPLLQPYLKNVAGDVLHSGNSDTSITVRIDFSRMGFTADNFIPDKKAEAKKGAMEEIKTDRMYRFTTRGENETLEVYIEGLGPVKAVALQTNPDFLKDRNITFVNNLPLNKKEYPNMELLAWNTVKSNETELIKAAFMKMPDAVLNELTGLRIGRAVMSEENAKLRKEHFVPIESTPDTLAEYFANENAIVFYNGSFQDTNVVLGDATAGTSSYLESIVMHELGHAADMAALRKKVVATPVYTEFEQALAAYRKVQDDADAAYVPQLKPYLDLRAQLTTAYNDVNKEIEKQLANISREITNATIVIGVVAQFKQLDPVYTKEVNRILGTINGNEDAKVPALLDLCREAAQDHDTEKLDIKEKSLRKETLEGVTDQTELLADLLKNYIAVIDKELELSVLGYYADLTLNDGEERETDDDMTKAFPDAEKLLKLAKQYHPVQLQYKAALAPISEEEGKPQGAVLQQLKDSMEKVNTDAGITGMSDTSGGKARVESGTSYYSSSLVVYAPQEDIDTNLFQVALQKDFGDYKILSTQDEKVDRPTVYADTNLHELYAESFTLYFADPERFSKMRPHLYMYFENKYRRWGKQF